MRNLWKFIPAFLVTLGILCFWLNPFLGFLLVFGFCWLFIPAIIVSIYFTIASCRLKDRWQKGLFAWGIFNVLLFGASFVFDHPSQSCDAFLMAEHYEKNKKAMEELVTYVEQALDDSAYVDLEFEDEESEIFHVSSKSDSKISSNWNDEAERRKDSLMKVVGLTPDEFEDIRHRLDHIECIGIEKNTSYPNGKTIIYFCRLGMGRYSFILYDNPISQEEKEEFMKNYEYIPYSDRVIFQYGGGAFGKQYFTKEERDEFLSEHQPW